jgi:hypothetical protein
MKRRRVVVLDTDGFSDIRLPPFRPFIGGMFRRVIGKPPDPVGIPAAMARSWPDGQHFGKRVPFAR